MNFTNDEKAKMFDEISEHFYKKNFGTFAKMDMELLMFKFYIEKLIDNEKNDDNTIDYNLCSDYRISKELGITQQKVRNLKVKKQLVYPSDFKWEKSLALLTNNARYDSVSRKISINIPDPNLFLDIQNFIEEHGGYIETQLNKKILHIRAEYYLALALEIEDSTNRKKIKKELIKELKESNKDEKSFENKDIIKVLAELSTIGANITSVVTNISSICPTNCLISALKKLLTS